MHGVIQRTFFIGVYVEAAVFVSRLDGCTNGLYLGVEGDRVTPPGVAQGHVRGRGRSAF